MSNRLLPLTAVLAMMVLPVAVFSAEAVSVESRIENVRETFSVLDTRAAACLAAREDNASAGPDACANFLSAIDGPLVATYLSDCGSLKQWRDEFIDTPTPADSSRRETERNLQRLRDIEFYCGEDALSRRTDNVQSAFNSIRQEQLNQQYPGAGSALNRLQFERALLELRRQSETSQNSEQRRLNAETERLWNELELELIRQRIDSRLFR